MRKSFIGIFHIACLFALGAFAAIQTSSPSLNKALEAQITLVRENPNNADALNDLGNLLELANRVPEAEAAYRRAIELADYKVLPHFNLGLLLQQRGQRDEALKEFHRVVELNPRHAWGHYQIGAIYEAQGLKEKAIHSYTQAFALDYDLTRPSVNPHIIENGLVVESMLKAYRKVAVQPLAPKRYQDAVRIVDLMVNEPPLPQVEGEEDEETEPVPAAAANTRRGGVGEVSSQAQFAGEEGDDEGAGDDGGNRVLNQETLRQNPAPRNEIGASGGVLVGGSRGRSTTNSRSPGSTSSGRPTTSRPSFNVNPGTGSTGGGNTVRRPTVPTRTRRGPGFIPSTGSTGRLDWQLRPAPPRGPEPAG